MSLMCPAREQATSADPTTRSTSTEEPVADLGAAEDGNSANGRSGTDTSTGDISTGDISTDHQPLTPHRSGNSAASRSWSKRAEGDRRATARLKLIEGEGVIVLNDRRIPGSKSSIKLIAVSPAGVFVIDTNDYRGLVHTRRQGPIQNLGPVELHVGRRNCTPSVDNLAQQVEVVREAISSTPWGKEVPIQALLCLTKAEWGLASPIEISDVWIGWPRVMSLRLHNPELMDSPTIQEVSELIADHLP
jgi:hypothetical protein